LVVNLKGTRYLGFPWGAKQSETEKSAVGGHDTRGERTAMKVILTDRFKGKSTPCGSPKTRGRDQLRSPSRNSRWWGGHYRGPQKKTEGLKRFRGQFQSCTWRKERANTKHIRKGKGRREKYAKGIKAKEL